MASPSSSNDLFSDTIFEILSRTTSLQALDTCKTVSKEWKELLGDSSFMKTMSERGKVVFGLFLQESMSDGRFAYKFVAMDQSMALPNIPLHNRTHNVKILASCSQGILLCEQDVGGGYKSRQYYVCKPATGQWMYLPNPVMKTRFLCAAAIVVVKSTSYLRYKIVRLSQSGFDARKYGVEIFDSKDWTWSRIEELVLNNSDSIRSDPAISVGNTVYWRLSKLGRDVGDVLSFCLDDYSFDRLSLPGYSQMDKLQLVEYKGKLGFTRLTEQGEMEVWLFRNPGNRRWTREVAISLRTMEDYSFLKPAGFYNSETAILKKPGRVVFYKIEDGSYSEVRIQGLCDTGLIEEAFQFRSDLESVNFRPPWLPSSVKSNVSQAKKTHIVLRNNHLMA